MSELPILVAGGTASSRDRMANLLRQRHYEVKLAGPKTVDLETALQEVFDLLVIVLPTDNGPGTDLLDYVKKHETAPPMIVVGEDQEITNATAAFEHGAIDHIAHLNDHARLYESLGMALGSSRRDSELRFFRDRAAQSTDWSAVIGRCDAMRNTLRLVQQIVSKNSMLSKPPILITGETGTGKGLLARCIHFNSGRRNEPYVDVNCAAMPPNLIEAELLGHERGAFTDAKVARPGLFETAHGGTLFLDEIAALRLDLQAKLLTVTEEKRVRRIGARDAKTVDVQILAATHRDLETMVSEGKFREDLYHRLNVISVRLPPLRERGQDKVTLAERFVEELCGQYGLPIRDLTEEARDLILNYSWPGNVRELRNQIERIILVADDFEIRAEHFQIVQKQKVNVVSEGADVDVHLPQDGISLEALERSTIKRALQMCDGNVSKAARFLSVSRQTLIYRVKKHNLGEFATPSRPGNGSRDTPPPDSH